MRDLSCIEPMFYTRLIQLQGPKVAGGKGFPHARGLESHSRIWIKKMDSSDPSMGWSVSAAGAIL